MSHVSWWGGKCKEEDEVGREIWSGWGVGSNVRYGD